MSAEVLVLATQNPKKGRELEQLAGGRFEVKTLAAYALDPEIVEDADTFAGNARIKVVEVEKALRAAGVDLTPVRAILADDSGIVVDALDGKPGVRSARFALDHGAGEGDEDNNRLLLAKMAAVPDAERTARFACAICALLIDTGAFEETFGTVEGRIARAPRGQGGFGYDPLFLPDAYPGRHMAELSVEEKHAISHRGKAMRAILEAIAPTAG